MAASREQVEVSSRAAWRRWLARHHADSPGIWLVTHKQTSSTPGPTYDAVVEEALCFGWIDSVPGKVDAQRTKLLLTPRKPGSGWSRINQERVTRLEAAGRIHPSGAAVIAAARADGSWSSLDAVEALEIPDDLQRAFATDPGAAAAFSGFPPSARKGILQWLASAKRPETRARRIAETVSEAAAGRRANQWKPRG